MSRDFQVGPSASSLVIDLTQDTSVRVVVDGPPISWEPIERLPDGGFFDPNTLRVQWYREEFVRQLPDGFNAFHGPVSVEMEFVIATNNSRLFGTPGGPPDTAALCAFALEAGNTMFYDHMGLVCDVRVKKRYRRAAEHTRTIVTVDGL